MDRGRRTEFYQIHHFNAVWERERERARFSSWLIDDRQYTEDRFIIASTYSLLAHFLLDKRISCDHFQFSTCGYRRQFSSIERENVGHFLCIHRNLSVHFGLVGQHLVCSGLSPKEISLSHHHTVLHRFTFRWFHLFIVTIDQIILLFSNVISASSLRRTDLCKHLLRSNLPACHTNLVTDSRSSGSLRNLYSFLIDTDVRYVNPAHRLHIAISEIHRFTQDLSR